MRLLNNKGYMLVEIVLASVIAMTIAYFLTDLTIKLKNKNDDLLVKTLAATDQAIIYNTIMGDLYNNYDSFDCDNFNIKGKKFEYKEFTNILSEYVSLGTINCSKDGNFVSVQIPLKVKQLPDEDFNVNINFTKG